VHKTQTVALSVWCNHRFKEKDILLNDFLPLSKATHTILSSALLIHELSGGKEGEPTPLHFESSNFFLWSQKMSFPFFLTPYYESLTVSSFLFSTLYCGHTVWITYSPSFAQCMNFIVSMYYCIYSPVFCLCSLMAFSLRSIEGMFLVLGGSYDIPVALY
jgi:hypothetical protein